MARRKWKEIKQQPGTAGQATCLAFAYFLSISCGPSTPSALYMLGGFNSKYYQKIYTPEYSYACLSPFQITRPRSDVAKGHEGRSKGPATTKATKINTGNGGGTGSHSNFIIWTAEGRKKKGKDEQVLMAADDDDDDGCSRTIGEDAKHLNVT